MHLQDRIPKALLRPFAIIYGWITRLRNWLYDRKIAPSRSFDLPIIGIGNLSAGGTGKTPLAEYVLKTLSEKGITPALLSRGYKRKTTGFQIVKPHSSAEYVGDEPYQIKKKFPELVIAVCEDRVIGIEKLKEIAPHTDVIVLDDSFQHRRLQTGLTILLTDYNMPFYEDTMLPAGTLRESTEGRKRADIIIMTKCPAYPSIDERRMLQTKMKPFDHQALYYTSFTYTSIVDAEVEDTVQEHHPVDYLKGYTVTLFTGIANPGSMYDFLNGLCKKVTPIRFPDHHDYTDKDVHKIIETYEALPEHNKLLLTTEKDWRRLQGTPQADKLAQYPLFFMPVSVLFDPIEKFSFEKKIISYVKKNKRNRRVYTKAGDFQPRDGDNIGDGAGRAG
ncbi:MAG: tetraacyldisaccharide 4'-kinase [Bacteroidota bacterium]|nr:tetraacyldisaccharide 4'-kinase [Bacteroidota bacterium]